MKRANNTNNNNHNIIVSPGDSRSSPEFLPKISRPCFPTCRRRWRVSCRRDFPRSRPVWPHRHWRAPTPPPARAPSSSSSCRTSRRPKRPSGPSRAERRRARRHLLSWAAATPVFLYLQVRLPSQMSIVGLLPILIAPKQMTFRN